MHAVTQCPVCGSRFRIQKESLGKTAKCKRCGEQFRLREVEAEGLPNVPPATPPVAPPSPAPAEQHPTQLRVEPGARAPRRWRNSLLLVAGAAVVLLTIGSAGYLLLFKESTTADVVARVEDSVALLHDGLSCGTAFLVDEGLLATNAHVVQLMFLENVTVYFPSIDEKERKLKRIVYYDESRDLCLAEIDANQNALALAAQDSFRHGDDVVIIGNPAVDRELVLKNAVLRGVMSSEATIRGQRFYQISASINPGNSGGPVLNKRAQVVAIATLKAEQQEGIAFGVPVADLRRAVAEVKAATPEQRVAANELHLARVTFRWLRLSGAVNVTVMEDYVGSMESAINLGRSASDGLITAQATYTQTFQQFNQNFPRGVVQRGLRDIQRAGSLDEQVKKNLLDLWACEQEIVGYVENPRGSLLSYRDKSRELSDEFTRLANQLKIQLDVSIEGEGG